MNLLRLIEDRNGWSRTSLLRYTHEANGAPGRAVAFFGGLLSVLLGILIAVELPSSAAWAIGLLVGINLIFWSVRAAVAARFLNQG